VRPVERARGAGDELCQPILAAHVLELVAQRAAKLAVAPGARDFRKKDRRAAEAERQRHRGLGGEQDKRGTVNAVLDRELVHARGTFEPYLSVRRHAAEAPYAHRKPGEDEG